MEDGRLVTEHHHAMECNCAPTVYWEEEEVDCPGTMLDGEIVTLSQHNEECGCEAPTGDWYRECVGDEY